MLTALSIRDIVLIEALDLALDEGLSALTGETGAGKSILLDSLGLATGARADAGLVRSGAEKGTATAIFETPSNRTLKALLEESGIEEEGELILRRVQSADGRTRAFVNDQPVSVALLRQIGDMLVEVHGQHDTHGLLDAATHRGLLDAFGGLEKDVRALTDLHSAWKAAQAELATETEEIERARADADYLRVAVGELRELAPEPGEEDALAGERTLMMSAEKISADLTDALATLEDDGGVEARLAAVLGRLEARQDAAAGRLDAAVSALDRAVVEAGEARAQVAAVLDGLEFDADRLEQVEGRLFALRAAARKHSCTVDDLPQVTERLAARLEDIEGGEGRLSELTAAAAQAHEAYLASARKLSDARAAAARKLDKAVAKELPPLKLDKARFHTEIDIVADADGGPDGLDRVRFEVATNPGAPFAPLAKIASGGELARFMLALKVSLAARGGAPVLIFDEVDAGVGGAVAQAVGERLAKLAQAVQVLVVTHSPQVAARADNHLKIEKRVKGKAKSDLPATHVTPLESDARREEIARMLAGATVTDAARAAADQLIGAGS
ncbi:DNA repair protein RecN [Pyruvatibacter mobilis]|uniref:DNA repair protein RecN n=1 Tax=Pyruvatibacter mobilis TaxID=1712261 RepID=UPI003BAA0F3A